MKTSPRSSLLFALVGAIFGLFLWRRFLPRPLSVETLEAVVDAGASVDEVARHAAELAGDEAEFAVSFEFNGVKVVVDPGATQEAIAQAIRGAMTLEVKSIRVRAA